MAVPEIPAFEGLRSVDCFKFEASWGYYWATQGVPDHP